MASPSRIPPFRRPPPHCATCRRPCPPPGSPRSPSRNLVRHEESNLSGIQRPGWWSRCLSPTRYCRCDPPPLATLASGQLAAAPLTTPSAPHTQQLPTIFSHHTIKWWAWPLKFVLEIAGKLGAPTHTLSEWLIHRRDPLLIQKHEVFKALKHTGSPLAAYQWLRQSYAPTEALGYLLVYIGHHRLRPGTAWDVDSVLLQTLADDGLGAASVCHWIDVATKKEGYFLRNPFKRFRQVAAAFAPRMQEAPLHELDRAQAETGQHGHFLEIERHQAERAVLSELLEASAEQLQHLPTGGVIQVRLGAATVTLANLGETVRALPQAEATPSARVADMATRLRRGEPLEPLEAAFIEQLVAANADVRDAIAFHTAPLADALHARQRAGDLLAEAHTPDHTDLRQVVDAVGHGAGAPIAVDLPEHARITFAAGTKGSGLGRHMRADVPPSFFLGPYAYAPSHVLTVSPQQGVVPLPALMITDRCGHTFHCTEADLGHLIDLWRWFRRHSSGDDGTLRLAYAQFLTDVLAAWQAVGLAPRRVPGLPDQVDKLAAAIGQTNWGVRLLLAVDDLWEDSLSVARLARNDTAHVGTVAYRHAASHLRLRAARLRDSYLPFFTPAQQSAFATSLMRLVDPTDASHDDPVARKAAVVRAVYAQLRAQIDGRPWLAWPGTRLPALVDYLRFFLSIPSEDIQEWIHDPTHRERWQGFTRDVLHPKSSLRLEQIDVLAAGGAVTEALAELHWMLRAPRTSSTQRMLAIARLADLAAAHSQWADVELALRELSQMVITGHAVPPEVEQTIGRVVRAHRSAPFRIPTTLQFAIPNRLDIARAEAGSLTSIGEQVVRLDANLRDAPFAPWERWIAASHQIARRWHPPQRRSLLITNPDFTGIAPPFLQHPRAPARRGPIRVTGG
ncbi:MAG: hypothetical protein HY696_11625 [Deltaproteobacteria bacterium]|nr:hypothetical protein [Deltaproteobacteria bacterium]